jgi:hypothetical protein
MLSKKHDTTNNNITNDNLDIISSSKYMKQNDPCSTINGTPKPK